ncbi:hypothetical protein AB205_0084690 [Aquarana catesbeiana]|uniref:Uncharacterized protein n=1 Tax=Aquarana catesbeiana TaxID=8400 RepID=A0A2G9RBD4_AQUCT|nr:hypothetical protein AB205_0084690 [Aquarana catesbeiana]
MSLFHTQESISQEVAGPSRLPETQVHPLCLQRKSGRKRSNLEKAAIDLFWKATEALRTPHSVADLTACKMQHMEEGQRLLCPTPPATPPTPEPQPGRKRVRKTRE